MRKIIMSAELLLVVVTIGFAQSLPPVQTKTLDGTSIALPGAERTKPLLLLLGFSHKSDGDFKKWGEYARTPYVSDPRIDYYELVDLQGVPSIIRKMILHGMRRAVKGPRRSHFAPFYQHESDWKALVKYDDPKVAYVVLADASGQVVWQTRGPAAEVKAAELESMITKLLAQTHGSSQSTSSDH